MQKYHEVWKLKYDLTLAEALLVFLFLCGDIDEP